MNKVTIEQIELDEGDGKSPHIPVDSKKFIDHGKIMKTLAIGIRDNMPILMIGESGTGKTSAVRYIAEQTKHGLRRVPLNGGTTADELKGRILINEKGTYWVDGILTEAMRNGEWIVLDEINAALPEVLMVLQSVLDDDGYLVLEEKDDKEIVRKHPNFRLFATCNPPEYAGTKEMNKALLSRFAICINADFPTEKKELEIIEYHLGTAIANSEMAQKLVTMAKETRTAKNTGQTDYAINTRDILNALKLVEFVDPIDAIALAFSNKLDSSDNKAIQTLAKIHLPSTKQQALSTRVAVKSVDELTIGQNYIIDADLHETYYNVTKVKKDIETLEKENLGTILTTTSKQGAVKGDQFKIKGFYYENATKGAETKEKTNLGKKAASLIKFSSGSLKGQTGVILHHKDLGDSIKIIPKLYTLL